MKKIVAVYKNKKFDTCWGFIFDTDVQMFVETFMQQIHIGTSGYTLCFDNDKSVGIYTEVKVTPVYNDNKDLIDIKFEL